MYIYNGKFYKDIPQIRDYNKKVKVDKENILFTFVGKENLSKEILYTFNVDYYNTPIDVSDIIFEKLVDLDSLALVVKEYLKGEKFLEIKKVKPKEVVLSFNLEKWIHSAIKPINISRKKGVGTYYIKANVNLPTLVKENFSPDDASSMANILKPMLSKSDYYIRKFRGSFPKEMIFKEHKRLNFIEIGYDLYNNRFEISIRNDILQMLYFSNLGRQ